MKEFVLTKTCFYYDYVYEIDNSILEKECLTAFEKGKLVSSDESSTLNEDLHIPKSKELKKLVSSIQNKFKKYYNVKLNLHSFWSQVHEKNCSSTLHNHFLPLDPDNSPIYSAAYYVKVPKDAGKIIFDYSVNSYNHTKRTWVQPEPHVLLIFPSYLNHFVTRNKSEEKRIVISFNFTI
jgi:uncharacterized protein (TIGR02466 family)